MNTFKEIAYYECSDGSKFTDKFLTEKYIKFCDLIDAIEIRYLNNNLDESKHFIQQNKMNVDSLIHDVCVYASNYLPSYKPYFDKCINGIISVQELYNAINGYRTVIVLNKILNRIMCISKETYREYTYLYVKNIDAHHVYIKGNKINGKKIIKYLEDEFDGINMYNFDGCNDNEYYYIDGNNVIECKTASFLLPKTYYEIELPSNF